jgi:N-acetylglucosamine kinase-like BadF-type ATPase
MMKSLIFLLSLFSYAHAAVLCIDGGGSKTLLQMVDEQGQLLPLSREAGGSNINTVGFDGVRAVFARLFEGIEVSTCQVIAGLSGVGTAENKQIVSVLFEEWGIKKENVQLFTDAELALQLMEGEGAILICGTGSICLSKHHRVGGLGRILGDEGSGYRIGLLALKAALEEEYGWGEPTTLTPALKELFGVSELKNLIRPLNLGEISSAGIAKAAPLVFDQAEEGDAIALAILDQAATELSYLLNTMGKQTELNEVHLWGGVFKNTHADAFIQKILEKTSQKNLKIINRANQNPAVLVAINRHRKDRTYRPI